MALRRAAFAKMHSPCSRSSPTCPRRGPAITCRRRRPALTRAKLDLYDRYHAFQTSSKGWPELTPKDPADYRESYVDNPDFTREWQYHLKDELIGVGYVDHLSEGLSAIYFFYEPKLR